MALYPGAILKLIPPSANDPRLDDVFGTIGHVAVSEGSSLYSYFATRSGGIESHFYVRRDGTVEQYRDTQYEADANYHGNSFMVDGRRCGFISYETQGGEFGEWTAAQVEAIKRLIAWCNATHGSLMRKAPAWNRSGHGYHRLFGEWNYPVHSCPGPDRVKQFERVIVPWMNAGGHLAASPTKPVPAAPQPSPTKPTPPPAPKDPIMAQPSIVQLTDVAALAVVTEHGITVLGSDDHVAAVRKFAGCWVGGVFNKAKAEQTGWSSIDAALLKAVGLTA